MKLDITKPYGTIHGTYDRRRYEQGGKIFDDEMNEMAAPAAFAIEQVPSGPRKRTREEEEQYMRDVQAAAALLAAKTPAVSAKT